jgi:hypothetical protein
MNTFCFAMLGIKSRALHILGKQSTTELHPQSRNTFLDCLLVSGLVHRTTDSSHSWSRIGRSHVKQNTAFSLLILLTVGIYFILKYHLWFRVIHLYSLYSVFIMPTEYIPKYRNYLWVVGLYCFNFLCVFIF